MTGQRQLAERLEQYEAGQFARPGGDPLGQRHLPDERRHLDWLVSDLCRRLASAGQTGLRSQQLVAELGLRDARALRLLVAYARVHHRVHQIVGVPGNRYYWGDCRPELYRQVVEDCRRRGRCYLFLASLHQRQGVAETAAGMVFDWFAADHPVDDLAASLAITGKAADELLRAFRDHLEGEIRQLPSPTSPTDPPT
jgi:hypothetical protein